MSNVIRSYQITQKENNCVIDNNELIRIKMDIAAASFRGAAPAPQMDAADEWDEEADPAAALFRDFDSEGSSSEDDWDSGSDSWESEAEGGFSEENWSDEEAGDSFSDFKPGISAPVVQAVDLQEATDEAARILENARAEAEEILAQARNEAQGVFEDAREQGYQEGREALLQELDSMRAQAEAELQNDRQALEEEYTKKQEEIEPILVDAILQVYNTITDILAEDRRDIVLQLINNVLQKVNISHDFIIRVSNDDYDFLVDNKDKIYGAVINDGNIEITADSSMSKNECIIETAGGMYDCSLDVQLQKLTQELKLLSCI